MTKHVRFRIDGREGRLAATLSEVANPSGWVREALRDYIAQGFTLAEPERTIRVTLRKGRDDEIIHALETLREWDESQARLVRAACAWKLGRVAQLDVDVLVSRIVEALGNVEVHPQEEKGNGVADAFVSGLLNP
jgi:AcrR family transcriptional regulator